MECLLVVLRENCTANAEEVLHVKCRVCSRNGPKVKYLDQDVNSCKPGGTLIFSCPQNHLFLHLLLKLHLSHNIKSIRGLVKDWSLMCDVEPECWGCRSQSRVNS